MKFEYNSKIFEKRLLYRSAIVILINVIFLSVAFFNSPEDKRMSYLFIFSGIFLIISALLYKNHRNQKKILGGSYLELTNSSINMVNGNGICNTINLKEIQKIEKDRVFGLDRFLLYLNDNSTIKIMNLVLSFEFGDKLEKLSKKKIEIISVDMKLAFFRSLGYFFPAAITYILYKTGGIPINVFFLILTINTIFFFYNFSEDKFRAGFTKNTVRRSIIILGFLFCYQLAIYFLNIN